MSQLVQSFSLLLLGVLLSLPALSQKVFYVTPDGAGTQDGSSWSNAYDGTRLQEAIEAASAYSQAHDNQTVHVWVRAGLYKPTTDDDAYISFSMRNQVEIYGGFVGTETLLSQRPPITLSNPSSTTLSGNIGDPEDDEDNTILIFENEYLDQTAVIDGFCLVEGNSGGNYGAGMHNYKSSPTIRNCCFTRNQGSLGAALYLSSSSSTVINCSFINNRSDYQGCVSISGGGEITFTNCLFQGNVGDKVTTGGHSAGVLYADNYGETRVLIQFNNCTFVDNRSETNEASLFLTSNHTPGDPSALTIELRNCLAWNNSGTSAFIDRDNPAVITANYCLFDPSVTGYTGENNRTVSTLPFESETSVKLTACSPAVDAGDPASTTATSGLMDLEGNLRIYGGRIDIGALENQSAPPSVPVFSLSPNIPQPIFQNTPSVSLTVTGCEGGTVSWQQGSLSGTGTAISVPTSATSTLVYSATCTVGRCSSEPGSFTVSIIPAPISGNFDGYIYGADCGTFRGWAWDRGKPNTVQSVDILDGPTVLASIPANEFRQDLKDAGKGNGIHAFRWNIPEGLKDGKVHYLSARVAGSSFYLKDSPKALICQGTGAPDNQAPVPPVMTPLTAQQGVAFSTVLPAFTDPEGSPLSYGLVTLPTGLSFSSATRQLSGTPTQSGVFVLTYLATDGPGATNSVSFNLTVNPAASTPVTGSFEGYLDKVECGTIRGWVWDRNKPNTPVSVEFYTPGNGGPETVWGSTVANIYRVDLLNAGKGNGAHAYSFEVPAVLKDGQTRSIRARVLGSTYDLKDSGKPLTCYSPTRLSAENLEDLQVKVLGNPVTDAVEVEIRGAQGQPLRLQLTDGSGRLVTERQVGTAQLVEHQSFGVREQPAGLLLLRVSSGLKTVTVKVLKP